MALKPYRYISAAYEELSVDDDFTNPLKTTHDGKNGDAVAVKVFLRNDDSASYYTDIRVFGQDSEGTLYEDIAHDETGWGIKLKEGEVEPSSAEWDDISWGNSISVPDIGSAGSPDTSTYRPFWLLISCPPMTEAQNKKDIQLKVDYIEEAV